MFQVQGACEGTARPRDQDLEEIRSVDLRVLLMFTCIRIHVF